MPRLKPVALVGFLATLSAFQQGNRGDQSEALAEIEARWANLRAGPKPLTEREAHQMSMACRGLASAVDFAYLLSKQMLKSCMVPRGGIEPTDTAIFSRRIVAPSDADGPHGCQFVVDQ
jgi:hypothetical protein